MARMTDDLRASARAWCERNDGGRLGVWWPAGSNTNDPEDKSQPIMSVMWDHGGTGELGVFYDQADAGKMQLICDVFNWALEQLAPSEMSFYGTRTYGGMEDEE